MLFDLFPFIVLEAFQSWLIEPFISQCFVMYFIINEGLRRNKLQNPTQEVMTQSDTERGGSLLRISLKMELFFFLWFDLVTEAGPSDCARLHQPNLRREEYICPCDFVAVDNLWTNRLSEGLMGLVWGRRARNAMTSGERKKRICGSLVASDDLCGVLDSCVCRIYTSGGWWVEGVMGLAGWWGKKGDGAKSKG